MKRTFSIIIAVCGVMAAAGCATTGDEPVRVYTFEKERVDQKLKGNQGYLQGTPPEMDRSEDRTRTIIGVDVELPSGTVDEQSEDRTTDRLTPSEKDVDPQEQATRTGIQKVVVEQPAKTTQKKSEMETETEKKDESEEYWIK